MSKNNPQLLLRKKFLNRAKHGQIIIVAINGSQISGQLTNYDDPNFLFVNTAQYGSPAKEALITNFIAVKLPAESAKSIPLSGHHKLNYVKEDTHKYHFLENLCGKSVCVYASNGYQLHGRLITFDKNDLVITVTDPSQKSMDVLVCGSSTVVADKK